MGLETNCWPDGGTAEEIRQTNVRCDLILECKHQIEFWRNKLEALEDEQTTFIKLARLRQDAPATWRSLSRRERMEKKFILAALQSPELPSALAEFPSCAFPPHIRLDREILLARVNRPDFGEDRNLFHASQRSEDEDESAASVGAMDRYFFVPPRLRSDKEVILAILPKYPYVIECMSGNLRDDADVLMELLDKHPGSSLPSNFIQHFSDRLRSCRETMLEVVRRHPLGVSALGFCGHDLRNDKDFILRVISVGSNHRQQIESPLVLRFASHRLRADRDVVSRAVALDGFNLKHASYSLRRDQDIVLQASKQNGGAFRYCLPGDVKDELFLDRDFIFHHAVSRSPNYVVKNGPSHFHNDRELLLKAAVHGLNWDLIPPQFQTDQGFIVEMIETSPRRYLDLPESMKESKEVALAVFRSMDPSDEILLEATEQCPELLSDREAMWTLVNMAKTDIIQETVQFSPIEIRSDRELMLQAVKADPGAFDFCDEDLQLDPEVVMAALPTSLYMLTDAYQCENPQVVIAAIEKTEPRDLWMTHDDIFEGLFNNRDVALAWLKRGGDWLSEDFDDFENDEELLLVVAEHNWSDFDFASEALKNNKEFMLRAIALDARVVREVSDTLRHDDDIALAAFSRDVRSLQVYSGAEDFEFMVNFAKRVRRQIEDYYSFQNEIVKNMSGSHKDCRLGMLNQGNELLDFYAATISSFLGLPSKESLQKLETVSKNLLCWGL